MAMIQLGDDQTGTFSLNVDVFEGLVPIDTVFLHGNLAANVWWEPALELWKAQAKPTYEGRLIFIEWRGCGKSDAPRSTKDLLPAALAHDTCLALAKLNAKKSCLVGHSTGGLIALCALLEAPELFDRVVLLDPVGPTGVKFEKPMYDAFTQMSQDREFCATVMNGTIHQNDPTTDLFRRIVDAAFGIDKSIWHGIPDALRDVDITNQLSRIQHPTLILHGEHDPVLPKEVSAKLATQLPNARYKELLGQGHSTNVENPELFVREVSHFLFDRP